MKATINHKQKILAAMLLVAHVFTVSTYIIFLQSRIAPSAGSTVSTKTTAVNHFDSHGRSGNFYDKQHGAFKSTFPNKRKIINPVYSLVCVAVLALVLTLRSFYFNRLTDIVTGLMYAGRPCYLSLRVLRI